MTSRFEYLIDKIDAAEFQTEPFRHIYIENFFSDDDFAEIVGSNEIQPPSASRDEELIVGLKGKGFLPIEFPGCVTDIDRYIEWHCKRERVNHHSACEGFGIALRLYDIRSVIIQEIDAFIGSERFNKAIAQKLNVEFDDCVVDGGIQKYLDGYEISPHPDIRKKAATFMVNINPSPLSEELDHHTHYLSLNSSRRYVQEFWEGNEKVDRCWVPWSWANSTKQQRKNNSIVIFSPSNDTLHGVKANYDHFVTQRTQLYGNLWYKEAPAAAKIEWEQLDLLAALDSGHGQSTRRLTHQLPNKLKSTLRNVASFKNSKGRRNV